LTSIRGRRIIRPVTIGDQTVGGGAATGTDGGQKRQPPPPPPFPWPAYIEELRQAGDRKNASFPQTFMAIYIAGNPWLDRETKDSVAALYPGLLECFEQAYGIIIDSRYGNAAAAGAVLLARGDEPASDPAEASGRTTPGLVARGLSALRDRMTDAAVQTAAPRTPRAVDLDAFVWWQFLHFDSQDATELLADVLSLRDRITTFLPGLSVREADARDIALRRLYGIGRELIESIDGEEQRSVAEIRTEFNVAHPSIATLPMGAPLPPELWAEFQNFDAQHKDQRPSTRFVRGVASLRTRLSKTSPSTSPRCSVLPNANIWMACSRASLRCCSQSSSSRWPPE
jgi:hypothetical protein